MGEREDPENYVGYERTEGFVSPGGAAHDKSRMYELPARIRRNDWALSGDWTIKRDAVELNKPNGRIAYRFHLTVQVIEFAYWWHNSRTVGPPESD